MRYASVCDGIGAVHCAWKPLSWECVWTSEIEKFPIAVVEARCPGIANLGDMNAITEEMLDAHQRPDLVVGGTPCQSFSVAGLRGGLADARGNLALRFVELVGVLRPTWVVWENVPGVLSSGRGRDFGSILGALAKFGYGWAYRVLDAQYFGVAQRRRRVFVVGCLGDWRRAAAVLFEREGVRGDPPTRRSARQGAAPDAGRGAEGAIPSTSHDPACCLTAREMKGPLPEADLSTVVMEPFVKSKRAQSASDDETWKADGVSPTLNHFDVGDTRSTTVVAFTQNQRDEVRDLGDTAGAVQRPGTHQSTCVAEVSPCLRARSNDPHRADAAAYVAEAFSDREDAKAGNFPAMPAEVGLAVQSLRPSVQSHHAQIFVAQPMQVRRLTPRECERLQGFPDDYTLIPWRKKAAEDCPDGPRYRALGNSMAVPVMHWIGRRIQLLDEMASEETTSTTRESQ